MATEKLIRVVTRASDGSLRTKDFENFDQINELHDKIGIDDCSTDLSLRGLPLFRGLVGPLAEAATGSTLSAACSRPPTGKINHMPHSAMRLSLFMVGPFL